MTTAYELACDGEFHPFRDHDTQFGWGIRHRRTGALFGYIGEKSYCFGVCAFLNGHPEAAKEFIDFKIPDDYFERFTWPHA